MDKRKQPNHLVAILLSLCMVTALVPVGGLTARAAEGDGTEENPYKITTQEELAAITGSSHYILMNDIELTGSWTPLAEFSGTLNGNNKTITGLNIESDSNQVGLFEVIGADGVVKDLTLYGTVNSTYRDNAGRIGGFAGINDGTISGCTFYGSVSQMQGDNQTVGGIAGLNGDDKETAQISNCKNYGDISGHSEGSTSYKAVYVGGIAGSNHGNITDCANAGTVYASAANSNIYRGEVWGSEKWQTHGAYVGGIAGDTNSQNPNTGNSSTGTVVGENSNTTENLTSIEQPGEVFVPSSTSEDSLGAYLPSSIKLNTTNGTSIGSVTWNTEEYDPDVENTTYTFTGTITLPSYVTNTDDIPLTATITVIVGSGGGQQPPASSHSHAVCGGTDCGHEGHESIGYTTLDTNVSGQTLESGNYYLTEDITTVNSSILIAGEVSLCLNGHTISGNASNGLFRIGADGVLNVCDCQGTGKIEETGRDAHNPVFIHSGGTLNLYSGAIASRITAIVIDEDPSEDSTNLTGGTVNIYGGTASSAGDRSQAIKVNPDMTAAAVSISGGEVTSPNNGISAESGTIVISGGTVSAQNGYAVSVTNASSKIYLSGSPEISGGSAAVNILPTSSAGDAVLVLHAKDDSSRPYTGNGLSISSLSSGAENKDKYVAQGVNSADKAANFSLAGLPDYQLAYDADNSAIQIKERTYTITLPSGQSGYTAQAAGGSTSPVEKGGSYSFTVTVDSADKYYETDRFAVKANDTTLTPDDDGVYTISNITADQTVTVEGVAQDTTAPTAEIQLGENKWTAFLNNITFGLFFKSTQKVTISASDSETGVEKMEYYISDTPYAAAPELEDAVGNDWKAYSASFSIAPDSKNIIYAKVTDKVGNVCYVSSQGIVLYADAQPITHSITFVKSGTADVTADVSLSGNTIHKIYCDDAELTAGKDYTVNGGTITFKADWLDTLAAANYTLTVHYNPLGVEYADTPGNEAPATTSIALKVQETTGGVTITNDISKIYDGQPVSDVTYQASSTGKATVEYKERSADASTYTTDKPSNVGEYTVRVTVAADGSYLEASDTKDFDIKYLTAPDPAYTLSGTEGSNGWYISDVRIMPPHGYTISGTLNGQYSDTMTVSASDDDIKIYLKNDQGQMTDAISVSEIKIDKDDPSITAIGDTDSDLPSDTVSITVSDNTSGVAKVEVKKDNGEFADITASYQNGYTITENGSYTFRVTDHAGRTAQESLVYDNFDTQKPIVTIEAVHGGAAYTSGIWTNQDITLTPKMETPDLGTTTYQYQVDGKGWQDYTAPIVIDTDTDGTVYEFKAKSASGVESDAASITVRRDTAAPDGDITIKESSIRQLLNAITFGLFFNEDVDVAITGTDALSGVASIQYYRSTEILPENEVTALEDWTEYDSAIHETAEDAKRFIYYVKVTDNAGNTTLFGSDGTTFDLTPPSITGVTNGSTCYTTQEVTITDTNLDSVTLNDVTAALENGVLTLAGNTDATYTIVATDKAGNRTTVTVTMKTIESLVEDLEGLKPDHVKPEDKEDLESVKEEIEQALEDPDNTYTEDEKKQLEETLDRIEEALEVIEKVEKVEDAISSLPESADPDDTEAQKQIEAAKDSYDALSDYEKTLISDEALEKLENLLAQLRNYRIIEGNGSTWTKGSSEGLTLVANGPYSKFTGLELDGVTVNTRNYTAKSGSTVVTLNPDYLNVLTAEEHSITILYTDGAATGTFTIAENPAGPADTAGSEEAADQDLSAPKSGDDSPILLWIMLVLISGGAILTWGIRRRA